MKKLIIFFILVILIFIIIFICFFHNQNNIAVRKEIMDTVIKMEKYPFVDFSIYDDEIDEQQNRCLWLYINASNTELYELLHYPNNNIKAFALYLLYHDKLDTAIFSDPTVKEMMNKNIDLYEIHGVSYKRTIREFIYLDTLNSGIILNDLYKRKTHLNKNEKSP
ncbi:MAG: hypothetical protein P1P88_00985 [Bacteroidales bacterium]|nr:hypothetical protein [Bacteroidales bacterium]